MECGKPVMTASLAAAHSFFRRAITSFWGWPASTLAKSA
jgi:hypothetical protein